MPSDAAHPPGTGPDGDGEVRHASAVAWGARGLLIEGPSGAGKSTLTLLMLALGAALVADDGVRLTLLDGLPFATAPAAIAGLVEARGTGLLGLPPARVSQGAWIVAVADLASGPPTQTDPFPSPRLPDAASRHVAGHPVALLCGAATPTFAASCLIFLKGGRRAP